MTRLHDKHTQRMKGEQLSLFDVRERNDYSLFCKKLSDKDSLAPDEFGRFLRYWSQSQGIRINALSLFSGAGGLDIGFEDAGFHIEQSVEIERRFVQTTLLNQSKGKYFSDTHIHCMDIRDFICCNDSRIDFIIGGPPCQSFSSAGRRAAGVRGINDDRGTLFKEYVRLVREVQPRGFLFENVYGLLGAQGGEAIKLIVSAFKEVGYDLSYRVLDAADYGVPQHRERLIIVGLQDKCFRFPRPTHGPDSDHVPFLSAEEALRGICAEGGELQLGGRYGHLLQEIPPGLNYSFFTEKMGHPNPIFAWRSKFSDFLYKADPKVPIRTLKASGGQYTGPFHWMNRRFTIQELKRLQTFPDDYEFEGNYSLAQKQIGNSVPPQFARILGLAIMEQAFNIELPYDLKYLSENEALSFRSSKHKRTNDYFIKAREAIGDVKAEALVVKGRACYSAVLHENFKWERVENGEYEVSTELEEECWRIHLKNKSQKNAKKIVIAISKQDHKALFRKVKKIELSLNASFLRDYTAAWKAFEETLCINNIKADLVQFSGYYQYRNKINYDLIFLDGKPKENKIIWKMISMLCGEAPIGKIEAASFFAEYFGIDSEQLLSGLKKLREIGFEIRNNNTNPEINKDHYLIPYRFPTLTPLSVQLKKSL